MAQNTAKDPKDLLSDAIRIVGRNALAVCSTVDASGMPHGRWMGTMAMDGLKRIYTLSGHAARKVEHIRQNPAVCWVFSTPDCADVVTLYCLARVLDDPGMAQAAWERLAVHARDYAMGVASGEDLQLVTLESITQRAEIVSPRMGIYMPTELPLG